MMKLIPEAYAQIINPAIDNSGRGNMEIAEAAASGATFAEYFVAIWQFIITVGTLAVLLYFLWGALEWILAGGDASKIQKGRDRIVQSIIGLVVLAGSFVIIAFISEIFFEASLGFNILQFNF